MDFKIRALRYFVTVSEVNSITRAAEILHVAQPSLSQRIRSLEELLGFPLFERSHGQIRLSHEGKIFLPIAKKLVKASDNAGIVVRNLRDGSSGTLRIGGSWFSLERPECHQLIDEFADQHPGVEVVVKRGTYSPELLDSLKGRELDVAFVSGPVDKSEFDQIEISPIVFNLLVPAEWPVSKRKVVPKSALKDIKLAWYRRENNPYVFDATQKFLSKCGAEIVSPPDTHLSALAHYAERRRIATFIGQNTAMQYQDMVNIPIEGDPVQFQSSLVRLSGDQSACAERFWQYVLKGLYGNHKNKGKKAK